MMFERRRHAELPEGVRALYPFQERYHMLRCGHAMHYVDEGRGRALLMAHGNPTWSFHYRELILALRDTHRCLAPDHVGCGLSDKPQRWSYRIADHVQNLCEFIERLDLRDITAVVHDWGGAISYLAALRMPERFSRFVVFNSAVFLLPLPRMLRALRVPGYGAVAIRAGNVMLRSGFRLATARPERFDADVRAGYLAPYRSWAERIGILRFVQEIPLERRHHNRILLDELERNVTTLTSRPHLIIWGMRDPVFDARYLARWRELAPAARVHAAEAASHWVVEDAAEEALSAMCEFLQCT